MDTVQCDSHLGICMLAFLIYKDHLFNSFKSSQLSMLGGRSGPLGGVCRARPPRSVNGCNYLTIIPRWVNCQKWRSCQLYCNYLAVMYPLDKLPEVAIIHPPIITRKSFAFKTPFIVDNNFSSWLFYCGVNVQHSFATTWKRSPCFVSNFFRLHPWTAK